MTGDLSTVRASAPCFGTVTAPAKTVAAIADVLDEFGQLTPADRQRFQQTAALALDRRFADHATRADAGGSA